MTADADLLDLGMLGALRLVTPAEFAALFQDEAGLGQETEPNT